MLEPTLNLDAMLSSTKVELDLISDVDMYLFFKKVWEVVSVISLEDTTKQTKNI